MAPRWHSVYRPQGTESITPKRQQKTEIMNSQISHPSIFTAQHGIMPFNVLCIV
jgi:hypothetical protein